MEPKEQNQTKGPMYEFWRGVVRKAFRVRFGLPKMDLVEMVQALIEKATPEVAVELLLGINRETIQQRGDTGKHLGSFFDGLTKLPAEMLVKVAEAHDWSDVPNTSCLYHEIYSGEVFLIPGELGDMVERELASASVVRI